ncbi:hypothetical protein BVRB_8g185110 [Beta vulgaris subsp. vulgaris]|uniref:Uncharacterized protein n=1 Tax=Beta vulgaris subsp. vulgaris TaxID=3555 RepID=A0A0J8EMK0_BETVV|nr:hypothetical protein BVRB_8g185110 [Beta vulgaris subsp. vulgaris]
MSTPPVLGKSQGNCTAYKPECIGEQQKQLFYAALVLIAVGIAGHLTSLGPFVGDQSEKFNNEFMATVNRADQGGSVCSTMCRFMLGPCMGVLIPIIGFMVVTFVKSWGVQFGVSAIFALASLVVLLSGIRSYKYVGPRGSALTIVFRVFFAAFSKVLSRHPQDTNELYEKHDVHGNDTALLPHTDGLSALVLLQPCSAAGQHTAPLSTIPLWMTFIICGVVSAIGDTYFLEQATTLNPKLGRIKVPLIFFLGFYDQSKSLFSKLFVMVGTKIIRHSTSCRRYVPPIGVAVAMVFSILCCVAASKIETRRLRIVKSHGLIDKPDDRVPMTIFWLLPQFALLGALDGIREWSVPYLVSDQAPPSMITYFNYLQLGVFGVGFMGSALSVYVVGKISQKIGGINWFQSTLNKSRLDNYYWVLAALSAVNLVIYIIVAYFYRYNDSVLEELEEPEYDETEDNMFNHL